MAVNSYPLTVKLRYESRHELIGLDGTGTWDYEVQPRPGMSWRKPKNGDDLENARAWLESAGYKLSNKRRESVYAGRRWQTNRWYEEWTKLEPTKKGATP